MSLFRDINIHASPSHYLFRSPSSPDHPALIIDRPSGDVRMQQNPSLAGKRVTSIAGILGMIQLRLGMLTLDLDSGLSFRDS